MDAFTKELIRAMQKNEEIYEWTSQWTSYVNNNEDM